MNAASTLRFHVRSRPLQKVRHHLALTLDLDEAARREFEALGVEQLVHLLGHLSRDKSRKLVAT